MKKKTEKRMKMKREYLVTIYRQTSNYEPILRQKYLKLIEANPKVVV